MNAKTRIYVLSAILSLIILGFYFFEYKVDELIGDGDGQVVFLGYVNFLCLSFLVLINVSQIKIKWVLNISLLFLATIFTIGLMETVFFVLSNRPSQGILGFEVRVNGRP